MVLAGTRLLRLRLARSGAGEGQGVPSTLQDGLGLLQGPHPGQDDRAERGPEACIPNDVKRDEAAVRVAHVLEEVLEEDPERLRAGEYKLFVGQVIALIWPCGVVS